MATFFGTPAPFRNRRRRRRHGPIHLPALAHSPAFVSINKNGKKERVAGREMLTTPQWLAVAIHQRARASSPIGARRPSPARRFLEPITDSSAPALSYYLSMTIIFVLRSHFFLSFSLFLLILEEISINSPESSPSREMMASTRDRSWCASGTGIERSVSNITRATNSLFKEKVK